MENYLQIIKHQIIQYPTRIPYNLQYIDSKYTNVIRLLSSFGFVLSDYILGKPHIVTIIS